MEGGSVNRNSLSNFNLWLVINKGEFVKAIRVLLSEGSSNYLNEKVSWKGRKWEKILTGKSDQWSVCTSETCHFSDTAQISQIRLFLAWFQSHLPVPVLSMFHQQGWLPEGSCLILDAQL